MENKNLLILLTLGSMLISCSQEELNTNTSSSVQIYKSFNYC